MKLIKTTEAVGQVLCHDITQIIPGVTKDAVFRKGHIITEEDIPVLLSVGKEHIYIWEKNENILHENEAAEILRDICMDEHMKASQPKEGKIELTAETDGLFLADKARLKTINSLGRMMIAIRSAGVPVKKGNKLCGTRIIPLVIEKEAMEKAKALAGDTPILRLKPRFSTDESPINSRRSFSRSWLNTAVKWRRMKSATMTTRALRRLSTGCWMKAWRWWSAPAACPSIRMTERRWQSATPARGLFPTVRRFCRVRCS